MKPLHITKSAYAGHAMSVLEMDIAPHTGNPKHFHKLFDETFEVLEGELFIGRDNINTTLSPGQSITVFIGSVHFFKNKTEKNCRIRITLKPGNTDFEDAMNIYYGLKKEGLVSPSGVPKKLSDLAIFIKLNHSETPGLGYLAGGLLNFIANRAIRKGRLETLLNRYAK